MTRLASLAIHWAQDVSTADWDISAEPKSWHFAAGPFIDDEINQTWWFSIAILWSHLFSCYVLHEAYLTAFGVFRRPPWKQLSYRLQTALAQAQQEHGVCVKHCVCGWHSFCVKQLFVQKMVWTQKHWLCSNHGLSLNQSMCVNQGFGKGHIENGFGKGHILKGCACKRCSAQKPVDQVLDIRSDGANRWQTQRKKRKQPSTWQQDVQNQAGVERGVGRVHPTTT